MRSAAAFVVVLFLAGCVGDSPSSPAAVEDLDEPLRGQRVHVFRGAFTATGDGTQTFDFAVPEGFEEVEGLLQWETQTAALSFALLDPEGEEAATGWHERDGRAYVTNTHEVMPGAWEVEVRSEGADAAVPVEFSMTVTARRVAAVVDHLAATFTIPPRNTARDLPAESGPVRGSLYGAGERDFGEINLNMAPDDWFNFSWNADREVYFNVHFHGEDGSTSRPIEERGAGLDGSFAANLTEVYALLWRNEGAEPVTVTVEMDGRFRLHSMSRDL